MKRRSHDKNTKHGNFLNHRHKRYKRLQMQTSESSEERNSVIQEFCHLTVPVTEQLKILYKATNHQETTSQFILWLTNMLHQTIDVAQHYRAKIRFLSTDSIFLNLHQRKLLVFLLENLQLRKSMEKVRLTFIFQYPHHVQHLLFRVVICHSQEARNKMTPSLFNHGFQQRNSENNVNKYNFQRRT